MPPGLAHSSHIALLRGVNVGGKNMLDMKALKAAVEDLGFQSVSTYINSGNVLFRSLESNPRTLEQIVEELLLTNFGIDCKVVIRSAPDMESLARILPDDTPDGAWKHNVAFLCHKIDSPNLLTQFTVDPAIERLAYYPGTLIWSVLAAEYPRTVMSKLSGQKLFRYMTVRNLNTTRTICGLLEALRGE